MPKRTLPILLITDNGTTDKEALQGALSPRMAKLETDRAEIRAENGDTIAWKVLASEEGDVDSVLSHAKTTLEGGPVFLLGIDLLFGIRRGAEGVGTPRGLTHIYAKLLDDGLFDGWLTDPIVYTRARAQLRGVADQADSTLSAFDFGEGQPLEDRVIDWGGEIATWPREFAGLTIQTARAYFTGGLQKNPRPAHERYAHLLPKP